MPFKIGDRVRLIEDYTEYQRKGLESVVTGVYETNYFIEERCTKQLVYTDKYTIFDFRLELVTPEKEAVVEKKFEVGKKYRGVNTQTIYTCIAVSNKRGWLCFEDSYEVLIDHKNCGSNFIEYVPPPKVVKKTGWVRVYAGSTRIKQPNVINDAGSLVFDTEDHAKKSHVKSTRPFFVTKIEWDEIVEDGDDDTI